MHEARGKYIAGLKCALTKYRLEGRDICAEIRFELPLAKSDLLYRLQVVDMIEKRSDGTVGVIEVNVDPEAATFPGMNIDAAVSWNGIEFRCTIKDFREDRLLAWGRRWLFDESPPLGPQDGFTGIIHSITQPIECGGIVEFSVDFGSAPIQALEELLRELEDSIRTLGSCGMARRP